MALNNGKVVAGGVAAGVVLIAIDLLTQSFILGDRMKADAEAFRPGITAAMASSSAIATYIITDLVIGLLLVWTYAAIRPRFGPGPRTSMLAAVLFWLLGGFFNAGYMLLGIMSVRTWWTYAFIMLIALLVASWAGARLYSETGETAEA
jgi:hypothetical protein